MAGTTCDADVMAAIETWRARGADRVAPVRFRLIEAMARRAQACEGTARAVIEEKLSALLAAQVADFELAETATATAPSQHAHQRRSDSERPLAQLVRLLDTQHPATNPDTNPAMAATRTTHASAPTMPGSPVKRDELKAVQQFRGTWRRIRTDQRLMQALADVPRNAGPLNSQRLIHRTLARMQDLSPEYLASFVTYVDALSWLDDVAGSGTAPRRSKTPGG